MAINIFELQPNKVNCNLLGYSFLFYGDPKTGKTTIASKFPKALLLAFEKGYAAIPGIIAQPINSWSEFKKVLKQLKEEKAKELFETIILDTGDIAYDYDISLDLSCILPICICDKENIHKLKAYTDYVEIVEYKDFEKPNFIKYIINNLCDNLRVNININDDNLQSIKRVVSAPFYPHCEILRSDNMKPIFWNYNITRSWFRN